MDRYSSANGYQYENDPAIWGYVVSANANKTLTDVTINVTENQADTFNFFGGAATTQTSNETNSAPSASDDSASTDEDTSVTVDAEPGTEVTVLWGEGEEPVSPTVENHSQREISATVAPTPYKEDRRMDDPDSS